MEVKNYRRINVGDEIVCIDTRMFCYSKKGIVEKIEIDSGAVNGWFHGKFEDGDGFLLAGEEIRKY